MKIAYLKHSIEASPLAAKLTPSFAGRQVPEKVRHLLNRLFLIFGYQGLLGTSACVPPDSRKSKRDR